ncbi:Hypothetical protein CAP_1426 [Chondromyces apiculatus DSM 436]|uniref:Uncharacterized protein n=1 Tax=Chondromyces apiculatus DSM 436 TaxID=1192034 RepID=A0A017TBV7_9BACT|nr:Hypothetical protein CAP_1426 [Chondromyces apiculatus DSM 436]
MGVLALMATLATSCRKSSGEATHTEAGADAGADAGDDGGAAAPLPPGAKACGHPAATPSQVVTAFLEASKARDLQGMLSCFKPQHRQRMAGREARLEELTVLSFTLGQETIDGESAEVQATVQRYDGRGGIEHKRDPIRLEREGGAWYFR